MGKIKYQPYDIDIQFELKTYKNVGKDYRCLPGVKRRFGIGRFFRMLINRKEKYYCYCNTYTEWKVHVQNVLNKHICNYDDLFHWLILGRNQEKHNLEAVKIVAIPIYVALATAYDIFSMASIYKLFLFGVIIIIVVIISAIILYNAMEKLEFYEDFIEIAEELRKG